MFKLYVEIYMPSVIILGGGAFGKHLYHEGGDFMNGIRAFIKGSLERSLVHSAM